MTMIIYLLTSIEVVSCVLLIGVILLQKSKGQGVGLAFGSGMGEAMFGSRVGNVLTKATVVLAIVFLANTTLLALLGARKPDTSVATRLLQDAPPGPAAAQPGGMPATAIPSEARREPVAPAPAGAPPQSAVPSQPAAPPVDAPSAEPSAPAVP